MLAAMADGIGAGMAADVACSETELRSASSGSTANQTLTCKLGHWVTN